MRPRPRVCYRTPQSADAVKASFRAALQNDDAPCTGGVGGDEVTLRIHERFRRPWSPWVQLALKESDGQLVLQGQMGPAPELWTAFVFLYSLLVAAFIAGSMLGLVQLNLGEAPSGLMVTAGAVCGLMLSCGCDLLGRRVGQGQMGIIRGFVRRTVPDVVDGED